MGGTRPLLVALFAAGAAIAGCGETELAGPPPVRVGDRPGEQPSTPAARLLRRLDPMYGRDGPRGAAGYLLGRSSRGRAVRLTLFGNPARRRVLVVGCIHGDECAGRQVVRLVLSGCPPVDADVWAIGNLNPDGYAGGSRLNGRGVDLNRNFPSDWTPIGRPGDPEHSGPRPLSEPETRMVARLIAALRPRVTIWFHQHHGPALVRAWGPSVPAARRYARAAGVPFRELPWLEGTAPNWQNRRFPGTASFVVELPKGARLARADATRHAAAVERVAGYSGENRAAVR